MTRGSPRDRSKLKMAPHNIRNRLRRRTDALDLELEALAEHTGYKPIDQWTFAELAAGKPKNPDGTWRSGKKPTWITNKIQQEIRRRLIEVGHDELAKYLPHAIRCMYLLIQNRDFDAFGRPVVDSGTKLRAAQFIVEQIMGKAKQRVDLGFEQGFRDFLAGALVVDGEPAHPVLQGEWSEENDDDDEE